MSIYEIIGIIGSLFIICSMSLKSDNAKGNLRMRSFNAIGSVFFIIYGIVLPAYSTAFLNFVMFIVNIRYIINIHKHISNKEDNI